MRLFLTFFSATFFFLYMRVHLAILLGRHLILFKLHLNWVCTVSLAVGQHQ